MRNRIDLRTLFQSLDDPAPSDGFAGRVMQQVAAANRPVEALTPASRRPWLPPLVVSLGRVPRWAQATSGALLLLVPVLAAAAFLVPSTWHAALGAVMGVTEAALFLSVWIVTRAAAVLAEGLDFLSGAVQVGEALDLVLRTPQAITAMAVAAATSLAAAWFLYRLALAAPNAPTRRQRVRGGRAGALLLVGVVCCAGLAFGQPQVIEVIEEEANAALEEAREQLDEALEEVGEEAQAAIEETIERLDDLERDLNGFDGSVTIDLDNKVAFGSTVRVGRDETATDIVSIGGGVKVDGVVRGDAVSIGGGAKIDGRVTGDVVALGGDVELGPQAEVWGGIVTFGGQVQREEGASVLGEVAEVAWGDWNWGGDWMDGWDGDWFPRAGDRPPFLRFGKIIEFVWHIFFTGLLIALSSLVFLMAPKGTERLRAAVSSDFWIMFAVGLAAVVFFLPALFIVFVALFLTIIGIPVAVLLVALAPFLLAVALMFGYTGVAAAAGEWCRGRFQGASRVVTAGSFGALALGVLTIQAVALVAELLGFLGLPWFFHAMFGIPGFLVCFVAWTTGLGAVLMTRFGRSDYGVAATPPPPPLPAPATGEDAESGESGEGEPDKAEPAGSPASS